MLDERTKNRVRLWLRSERALGLATAGPVNWDEILVDQPPPAVKTPQSAPVQRTHERPAARAYAPSTPAGSPRAEIARPAVAPTVAQPILVGDIEPFTSPVLSIDERRVQLATLDEAHVRGCMKCDLSRTRQQTVFGEGSASARLMFIGEGPGSKEDQTGRPFVGPAGELLNRMIGAMGLAREDVFIANVLKCRAFLPGPPPRDRAPAAEEVAACSPYLIEQVKLIRPEVIVTLGLPATQFVLQSKLSMSRLRGTWNAWHGIKVMPTWHPSYLLRREKEGDVAPKRQAWNDLQEVMKELGLEAKKKSE